MSRPIDPGCIRLAGGLLACECGAVARNQFVSPDGHERRLCGACWADTVADLFPGKDLFAVRPEEIA